MSIFDTVLQNKSSIFTVYQASNWIIPFVRVRIFILVSLDVTYYVILFNICIYYNTISCNQLHVYIWFELVFKLHIVLLLMHLLYMYRNYSINMTWNRVTLIKNNKYKKIKWLGWICKKYHCFFGVFFDCCECNKFWF